MIIHDVGQLNICNVRYSSASELLVAIIIECTVYKNERVNSIKVKRKKYKGKHRSLSLQAAKNTIRVPIKWQQAYRNLELGEGKQCHLLQTDEEISQS